MKDFLGRRPVYHWTEQCVRGHIAICVIAAVITNHLNNADIADPDLSDQTITARGALGELNRIRTHHLTAGGRDMHVITRRNPLRAAILAALGVTTTG